MLHQWIRVIGKKGATFTDLSLENSNFNTSWAYDYDAIYIGKQFAFNNFFLWIQTANATLENMKLSIWNGTEFKQVTDVMDASYSGSVSGVVQFVPDENDHWHREDTDTINDFSGFQKEIYNLYWLKLEFENPIDITTEIRQLSYAFCDEAALLTIDSDIDNYLPSLGKTDFTEFILMASLQTAIYLKSIGVIYDEGQIVQFDDFYMGTAYKTLEIIYGNLGPDFADKKLMANKDWKNNLKTRRLTIDQDGDGKVDRSEYRNKIRTLSR